MSKRSLAFIASFFLFLFSLVIYIYPAKPIICRDCGSIDNCLSGNGLDIGWTVCIIVSSESGINCTVAGAWCS